MEEEATKKRSRRSHKSQKGIEGASLTEILAKRYVFSHCFDIECLYSL